MRRHAPAGATRARSGVLETCFAPPTLLQQEVPWLDNLVHAKRPHHLPVVLTREEVRAVLADIHGVPRLMAFLLYGAGLRLLECARLRVKDIDIARNQIVVRAGKGNKDRLTMLPAAIKADLMRHLESVRRQHQIGPTNFGGPPRDRISRMSIEEIEAEALKLDPEARARLAEKLLESLETLSDQENEALWAEEADRRDADWGSPSGSARPAADVLRDTRAKLK